MNAYKMYGDSELVGLLKNGDQKAFTEIFERYHKPLFININKVVRNDVEAEDLLQSVFEILWDKRSDLREDKSVGGWLFTLSYCRTIDFMRKRIRERKSLQQIQTIYQSNSDDVSYEDQYLKLDKAIASLSPQKRKVFQKCKLEGKSYEKVALELGISKYTVGEYMKDSMRILRNELTKENSSVSSTTLIVAILTLFLS